MGFPGSATAGAGKCPEWAARVVSIEGRVEALPAGASQWQPVALNDTFCPEDQIRTLENSRAAVQLSNETMLRLDQNTLVKFSATTPESPSLLELFTGRALFMTRFPHPLTIDTPYVNASSGGTEYVIEVDPEHKTSTLTVIEGTMHLKNAQGTLTVTDGQSSVAHAGGEPVLRVVVNVKDVLHWALYYPPVLNLHDLHLGETKALPASDWRAMVANSITAYQNGDLAQSFAALEKAPADIDDPRFYDYRASLRLAVGRLAQAQADIKQALTLSPRNGLALALQSLIAVVQNQPDKALKLAQEAAGAEPESSSVRIALTYAWQANFNLPQALTAAQDATRLDPKSSLAWARTAELWLSQGYLNEALDAAKRAEALNSHEARVQTILGFAYLTQIKVKQAQAAFGQAIVLNSSDPLPRLGLGLAKIRQGKLAEGRQEIEIAAALDPSNSLIRSYLGKAYYEEKRDTKAAIQLDMAKKLDPKDPTPYLYDAILMQTTNRPVEALHDLQTSIVLNANRAPYRSRLQLDDDLATRSVSQGRIYADLGFEQAALVEGWKSVTIDPLNYSAHRFLADAYSALPNSNIARVSSLLQSQLLQPVNNNPVQPRLANSDQANLAVGVRPVNAAFNEYSQLFSRDGVQLLASGVAGGDDTLGQELIASGLNGRYSYSLGESHYRTDGYRPNADISNTSYDVFGQVALNPKASVQAEYRYNLTKNGDIDLRFDPDAYSTTQRRKTELNTARVGFHYRYSPGSETIANLSYRDRKEDYYSNDIPIPGTSTSLNSGSSMSGAELQHLYKAKHFGAILGAGHFEGIDTDHGMIFGSPYHDKRTNQYTNGYAYFLINIMRDATLTAGESINLYKDNADNKQRYNPKLGLIWNITPATTIRVAYFRVLSMPFPSDQTIEPVEVAGFQQYFDDTHNANSKRSGIGIDQKFSANVIGGMEVSKRNIHTPIVSGPITMINSDEWFGRGYVAWTPYPWMAAHMNYLYQHYRQDNPLYTTTNAANVTTQHVPLGINFYWPSGWFAKVTETYIYQRVTESPSLTADSNKFGLTDLAIGYRLPRRSGTVSVDVNNLFDRTFHYQDVTGNNPDRYPSILPERVIYTRLTLLF